MKVMKKIGIIFLSLILLAVTTSSVSATEQVKISQTETNDGQITVYINGIDENIKKISCLIASNPIENISFKKYNNKQGKIKTLILIDSSKSITKEEQDKFSTFVLNFIDNKNKNESISIATYGKKLNYLCDFENDRYEILKAFQKVKYKKQTTYLTDIVASVANDFNKIDDNSLKRIIIFSDGYDNNPLGITKEELYSKLEETPYPITAIGCVHTDNQEALKQLFALSRLTGGTSYRFDTKTKGEQLRKAIEDFNFLSITVKPEIELQDGSIKTVEYQINTTKESYIVNKDIRMHMAVKDTSEDENEPIKNVEETEKDEGLLQNNTNRIVTIIIVFLLIIAGGIGLLIWWNRRKNEKKILADINNKVKKPDIIISGGKNVSNQEYSSNIGRSFVSAGDELDKTVVLHQEEVLDRTIMLIPDDVLFWNVKLKDIHNNRIFVKELTNELIIGRVGSVTDQGRIVIDYESSVSKKHCRLFAKDKSVYITDMGSSNHTFLNGKMIEEEQVLNNGDVIGVGKLNLEVSLELMEA